MRSGQMRSNCAMLVMSIWTIISEECLQHLVKSMRQRIKADPKAQGTRNVDLKKIKSVMHFYELTALACEFQRASSHERARDCIITSQCPISLRVICQRLSGEFGNR